MGTSTDQKKESGVRTVRNAHAVARGSMKCVLHVLPEGRHSTALRAAMQLTAPGESTQRPRCWVAQSQRFGRRETYILEILDAAPPVTFATRSCPSSCLRSSCELRQIVVAERGLDQKLKMSVQMLGGQRRQAQHSLAMAAAAAHHTWPRWRTGRGPGPHLRPGSPRQTPADTQAWQGSPGAAQPLTTPTVHSCSKRRGQLPTTPHPSHPAASRVSRTSCLTRSALVFVRSSVAFTVAAGVKKREAHEVCNKSQPTHGQMGRQQHGRLLQRTRQGPSVGSLTPTRSQTASPTVMTHRFMTYSW